MFSTYYCHCRLPNITSRPFELRAALIHLEPGSSPGAPEIHKLQASDIFRHFHCRPDTIAPLRNEFFQLWDL